MMIITLLVVFAVVALAIDNPVDYVNIMGGTDSAYDRSYGNMLPLIGRPWVNTFYLHYAN